jgi:hypothetical protein
VVAEAIKGHSKVAAHGLFVCRIKKVEQMTRLEIQKGWSTEKWEIESAFQIFEVSDLVGPVEVSETVDTEPTCGAVFSRRYRRDRRAVFYTV